MITSLHDHSFKSRLQWGVMSSSCIWVVTSSCLCHDNVVGLHVFMSCVCLCLMWRLIQIFIFTEDLWTHVLIPTRFNQLHVESCWIEMCCSSSGILHCVVCITIKLNVHYFTRCIHACLHSFSQSLLQVKKNIFIVLDPNLHQILDIDVSSGSYLSSRSPLRRSSISSVSRSAVDRVAALKTALCQLVWSYTCEPIKCTIKYLELQVWANQMSLKLHVWANQISNQISGVTSDWVTSWQVCAGGTSPLVCATIV